MLNFTSLLSPSIMFFGLGLIAQLVKSDLKIPSELTKSITIYLLLSVGIHGGIELSKTNFSDAISSILVAISLGVSLPVFAYFIISRLGKIDSLNAIAIATHYGSVSAGTFLTAIAYLELLNISYEKHPIIMLAIMESPAILVGLFIVSKIRKKKMTTIENGTVNRYSMLREAFTNGSILLLFGGMLIGDFSNTKSIKAILPFFDQLFMGVLCIFLLAMGMEAGKKLSEFKVAGKFLITFGIMMPVLSGSIGVIIGKFILDFGAGGSTLVGVLAASASYIAVPPAMRLAIPEANPSIYLTLVLGVTFPFNVVFGIPIYYAFAETLM
jgi:uncharacterized protein